LNTNKENSFYLFFIYLSSAKNILHKARKRHNINKYRNTGRGDATAMPITAFYCDDENMNEIKYERRRKPNKFEFNWI